MGDLIELTTWPNRKHFFYETTDTTLSIEIKASRNARIGLSRTTFGNCNYWIGIGDNGNSTWIKEGNGKSKKKVTPHILNGNSFKKFWIMWNDKSILLGHDNNITPMLTLDTNAPDIRYFTLTVSNDSNPVHWRFVLPPMRNLKPELKPLTGGEPHWVPAIDQLPNGAIIGGYDDEPLYIIRAHHRGSVTPGKFVASEGLGYIPWGGEAHEKSEFEVLCGYNCTWQKADTNCIPIGAFHGGNSEDRNEPLYVGRAWYNGKLIPGKVQPSHKCLYIPYDGKEISIPEFEILVVLDETVCLQKRCFIAQTRLKNLPSRFDPVEDEDYLEQYDYEDDEEFF